MLDFLDIFKSSHNFYRLIKHRYLKDALQCFEIYDLLQDYYHLNWDWQTKLIVN